MSHRSQRVDIKSSRDSGPGVIYLAEADLSYQPPRLMRSHVITPGCGARVRCARCTGTGKHVLVGHDRRRFVLRCLGHQRSRSGAPSRAAAANGLFVCRRCGCGAVWCGVVWCGVVWCGRWARRVSGVTARCSSRWCLGRKRLPSENHICTIAILCCYRVLLISIPRITWTKQVGTRIRINSLHNSNTTDRY